LSKKSGKSGKRKEIVMKFDVRKLGIDPDAYDILKVFDCPESASVTGEERQSQSENLRSSPIPETIDKPIKARPNRKVLPIRKQDKTSLRTTCAQCDHLVDFSVNAERLTEHSQGSAS
jgi:hypothetical protein